jgi:hypothetical protein
MKKLALGTVGALAALFAMPQAAQAQFLSVGIGAPSYYGSPYYGYGYPRYGGNGIRVGFAAPAYSYGYGYGYPYAASSYGYGYDDFDDGYYAAPVVTRRVVYQAPPVVTRRVVYRGPRTLVRTRVVSNPYLPDRRAVRVVRYH